MSSCLPISVHRLRQTGDLAFCVYENNITIQSVVNMMSRFPIKPDSHTSPRQNLAILLCMRGVATPMCYEETTRNSVHLLF